MGDMDVRHEDDELRRLESDPEYDGGRDRGLARAYRKLLNLIRQVAHEGELYNWPSTRFEKLKGNRSHQRSLRINLQWRLIVEIEKGEERNILIIKKIEDYH